MGEPQLANGRARSLEAALSEAEHLFKSANVDSALRAYETIRQHFTGCDEAWFRIGLLKQELGELSGARAAWERCVANDPNRYDAWQRLGAMSSSLQRRLEAVKFLERACSLRPGLGQVRTQLATVLSHLNWWDQAREVIGPLPRPAPPGLESVRRNIENGWDSRLRAVHEFEVLHPPGSKAPWGQLLTYARGLFAVGRLHDARGLAARLASEYPHALGPYLLIADVIARQEGLVQAMDYMRGIDERVRGGTYYKVALARMFYELNDPEEVNAFLASVSDEKLVGERFHLLALNALSTGRTSDFVDICRRWIRHSPNATVACTFGIAAARAENRVLRLSATNMVPAAPRRHATLGIASYWSSNPPPPDVAVTMSTWEKFNPGHARTIFDTDSAREFVRSAAEPEVLACFDRARHPAMQSDILRLVWLARNGGIYVDADEACRDRFADKAASLLESVEFVGWLSSELLPYVFNGFMAARPECPIILDALRESVLLMNEHAAAGVESRIWEVTGPGLITRAVGRFVSDPANRRKVALLTNQEYHSFVWTNDALAYKRTPKGNWRLA